MYILFKWEILISSPLLLNMYNSPYVQFYCFLYWSLRQPGLKVMVWGSCPECHSGCHRASPKLAGSWLQVLSESLCLCFFLFSPGMQILVSHCPKEELVCRLLAWVGNPWFQTVNVALASCFAWGTYSHCHRIKFKPPLSTPTAQPASSFIPT